MSDGNQNPGILIPPVGVCHERVRQAIQDIVRRLGTSSTPTYGSLTLDNLTASKLVAADANKKLASADISDFVDGTTNQINTNNDGDGTMTLSTPQDIHAGASPTFAGLDLNEGNITNVGDVALDSLTADGTSIAMNSPVTGISLSEIENLEGDKTFTMAAKTLTWTFTNPNGGIKYEWLGGASGHLFELLQETGNPMAGTHLAHIDATDTDVLNLHLQHRGAAGTEIFRISDSTTTKLTIDNSGNISCNDITINSPSNIYSSLGGLLEDLNTLGASASDGQIIVATGAGTLAYESGDTARISLGFPTTAGASGKYLKDDLTWDTPLGSGLSDISGLTPTDGNIIVGDGSNWVAESGATARTSLGLGTVATQAANNVSITGGSIAGITDLAVADGGTGTSTGSITGTGALTFAAGGTDQDVTLTPSGAGYTLLKGNVGIGTSAPSQLLHIRSTTANAAVKIETSTGGGEAGITLLSNDSQQWDIYTPDASNDLRFRSDSTDYVTIDTYGNVGIGTTGPDYKGHVNGTFGCAPGSSVTPVNNGDVVFEATDNTTFTVKLKGSDGTVRSGTISLA